MEFKELLKENSRTADEVQKKYEFVEVIEQLETARYTLNIIKDMLIKNAHEVKYSVNNGITTVSCLYKIPYYYDFLYSYTESNIDEILENDKKFFLFKNPDLKYQKLRYFNVNPKKHNEYTQYISCLKDIAEKDGINIECVIYNEKDNRILNFPSKIVEDYISGWYLYIKATTQFE